MALLAGKTPDRIPTDYQATDEVTERLRRDLGCADDEALYRKLDIDARRMVDPVWNRPEGHDAAADMWGVVYRSVSYGPGAYLEPQVKPLAGAGTWPTSTPIVGRRATSLTTRPLARAVEQDDGYRPIHSRLLRAVSAVRLSARPGSVDGGPGATAGDGRRRAGPHLRLLLEHHRRIFQAGRGRIDLTYVAEDLGSQHGPLMSLAMYRRFLLPNQIKMADLARSFGIHVMYHTDGAARVFLPDLIDRVGIEILDPIQWRAAGMEREKLVADFGRRIIFHGSIDNQQTLPFGTVDDVIREVRESVEIYRRARWICAPCHNLQPVSPTANIVAMYQAIAELGRC